MAREKRITLRLSEDEKIKLENRANLLGLTEADCLRQMINKQKLSQPLMSREDIFKIIIELKEIQNILNENPNLPEVNQINKNLENIWIEMEKAVNRLG
jgi:hypothetical protein